MCVYMYVCVCASVYLLNCTCVCVYVYACVYVCVCVYVYAYVCVCARARLLHYTYCAIRPYPMLRLALVFPRGNQSYLPQKPLIRRDKGNTLSLRFLLKPSAPCGSLSASLLISRHPGSTYIEPAFSCQRFVSPSAL